jgi:hypothetical protein
MPLKRLVACTLFLLLICRLHANAQEAKGTTYRKISNDRLPGVLVTNLKTRSTITTDELGNYSISANKGDTLLFTKSDYTVQKQEYEGFGMVVYMQPEFKLAEVRKMRMLFRQPICSAFFLLNSFILNPLFRHQYWLVW